MQMQPYRPALRFKQGEYRAAHALSSDMQKYLRPYFIVSPPKESDPELGRAPTVDELGHLLGERLGKWWPLAPAYLDTQYVAASLGQGGLRHLFRTARSRNGKLIAVVRSADLLDPFWREFTLPTTPRLAVHLPFEDFDPDLIAAGIGELGISAQDCEVFVDFTGAELDPKIATDAIAGTLEAVASAAPWGAVVFQASNFPTTNPAEPGNPVEVPRHEWEIFCKLLDDNTIPAERLGFSDFGADCGKIAFPRSGSGGRPIPHIRYSTKRGILVVRGLKSGSHDEVMRAVFGRVVDHPDFAGQAFSPADRQLWEASRGIAGPGNASTWRQMNMTHHMARVLRDLARLAGLTFADGPVTAERKQVPLFDDLDN